MEREMLYLSVCKIFWRIGFERHAIITHPFRPVAAHLVAPSGDLAIFFVEKVIER